VYFEFVWRYGILLVEVYKDVDEEQMNEDNEKGKQNWMLVVHR
jgi:hypothetical protein